MTGEKEAPSPESKWHIDSKLLIAQTARSMGLNCREEVAGGIASNKWRADVYIEYKERKIAIEIQHSPQTLVNYLKRQAAYTNSGVDAYWLLYRKRFNTITKAMFRYRYDNEPGYKENFHAQGSAFQMLK